MKKIFLAILLVCSTTVYADGESKLNAAQSIGKCFKRASSVSAPTANGGTAMMLDVYSDQSDYCKAIRAESLQALIEANVNALVNPATYLAFSAFIITGKCLKKTSSEDAITANGGTAIKLDTFEDDSDLCIEFRDNYYDK